MSLTKKHWLRYNDEGTFTSVGSLCVFSRPLSRAIIVALSGVVALGFAGCSKDDKPQDESDRNLKALSVLWGKYSSKNRGVGPPNEVEFRKWIKSLPGTELESVGLDNASADAMFTSPRDNQPYGIAYKVVQQGIPNPQGPGLMVVWEKTGVNGKRKVADITGRIEEIDQATFEQRMAQLPKQ